MSDPILMELSPKLRFEESKTWSKGTRFRAYHLERHCGTIVSIYRRSDSPAATRSLLFTLEKIRGIAVPGVVPVWDYGQLIDGRCYWTTPAFQSGVLTNGSTKSFGQLLGSYRLILDILEAAHLQRLFHGGVDEESIVSLEGQLGITDFGLLQSRQGDIVTDLLSATEVVEHASSSLPKSEHAKHKSFSDWLNRARDIQSLNEITSSLRQLPWEQIASNPTLFGEPTPPIPKIPAKVGSSMPVLAETFRALRGLRSLERFAVLHINHLLDDILDLNELLAGTNTHLVFIALPYSKKSVHSVGEYDILTADPLGQEEFKLYANTVAIGTETGLIPCVESLIEHAICNILKETLSSGRKLIILEDGGYHYSVVGRLMREGALPHDAICGTVEQTMSGVLRYSALDSKIEYPVLTCARSDIKIRLEAFFVGQRVVEELAMLLYEHGTFLSLRHVLVIGYGIVGRNIALSLAQHNCRVSVYDNDPEMIIAARNEGFAVRESPGGIWPEDISVVVGATGEPSYTLEMLRAFLECTAESLFLVSASSKRIEFSAILTVLDSVGSESGSDGRPLGLVEIRVEQLGIGFAYHVMLQGRPKTIYVVANGYPVNFFRGGCSLSPRMIDPVNAELLLLVDAIVASGQPLAKRLHVLGYSQLDALCMSESKLLKLWYEANALAWPEDDAFCWDVFRPHPAESRLRLRNLKDSVELVK